MENIILIYSITIVAALSYINFIIILKGIKNNKYIWFNTGLGALMIGFIVMGSIILIGGMLSR